MGASARPAFLALCGIDDLFDQETADTLEVGVKGQFLDPGGCSASANVYHTTAKGTYFFVFLH